ncbi:hypothetical protein QTH49_13560 [Clostridium perfringens]|nr:hypothetical protein [Clostridium perfringens]
MKEDTIMEILIRVKQNFEKALEIHEENEKLAEYVNEILENEGREPTEEEINLMDEIEAVYDEITSIF